MIRTVLCEPLLSDWIAFQVDELRDGAWVAVAARPRGKDQGSGVFHIGADFSPEAETYRVVWVGLGGSKNMRISETLDLGTAPAQAATYGGAR